MKPHLTFSQLRLALIVAVVFIVGGVVIFVSRSLAPHADEVSSGSNGSVIWGTVEDEQHAELPNILVTIGKLSAVSNDSGFYAITTNETGALKTSFRNVDTGERYQQTGFEQYVTPYGANTQADFTLVPLDGGPDTPTPTPSPTGQPTSLTGPQQLRVIPNSDGKTADVNWTDFADGETNFVLEQSKSSLFGTVTSISVPANPKNGQTTYKLILPTPSETTTYYYRVIAAYTKFNTVLVKSAYSNVVSYTVRVIQPPSPQGPRTPSSVGAKLNSNTQNPIIFFIDESEDERGFKLFRSTDKNSGYVELPIITNLSTGRFSQVQIEDTTLTPSDSGTFYYRVRAYKFNGPILLESPDSDTTQITISAVAAPTLVRPTKLTATAQSGQNKITWKGGTTESYVLERATDGKTFTPLAELVPGTKSFVDNYGLTKGTTYTYRIRAFKKIRNQRYYGDYSNTDSARAK